MRQRCKNRRLHTKSPNLVERARAKKNQGWFFWGNCLRRSAIIFQL